MAVNKPVGDGQRIGAVRRRSQLQTKTMGEDHWTKRNKLSGRFMDQKKDDEKFKGVRREKTLPSLRSKGAAKSFESQIVALEKQFWQSMIDKDSHAGSQLTANPCLVTGAQGVGRIDRKTFAKMMETGTWVLHDFSFSDVKVQKVTDDVAVIAYKVRENLTVDGKKLTVEAADASTWVRDGDVWVCVLHTESVLGDPYGRDRKPAKRGGA